MDVLIITPPLITPECISVLLVYGYHLPSIIGHITLLIEPILTYGYDYRVWVPGYWRYEY